MVYLYIAQNSASCTCISCMVFLQIQIFTCLQIQILLYSVLLMLSIQCLPQCARLMPYIGMYAIAGCLFVLYLCFVPFEYVLMCVTVLFCFYFVSLTGDTIGWWWCNQGSCTLLFSVSSPLSPYPTNLHYCHRDSTSCLRFHILLLIHLL